MSQTSRSPIAAVLQQSQNLLTVIAGAKLFTVKQP